MAVSWALILIKWTTQICLRTVKKLNKHAYIFPLLLLKIKVKCVSFLIKKYNKIRFIPSTTYLSISVKKMRGVSFFFKIILFTHNIKINYLNKSRFWQWILGEQQIFLSYSWRTTNLCCYPDFIVYPLWTFFSSSMDCM